LKRLNYFNLLCFNQNDNIGKLSCHKVPDQILEKYKDYQYSWFSYFPLRLEIDITNQCNYKCAHCSRNAVIKPNVTNSLTTLEIKNIIGDAASLGTRTLVLMGGEPLMHKDFFEICDYSKRRGIRKIETSTNGSRITENVARKLAKYLDNIQLSVLGSTAKTHDKIVGVRGAWEKIIESSYFLHKSGISIQINFTIMENNLSEIELMPKFAKEIGANSLRFSSLIPNGRGGNLHSFSQQELISIGSKIEQLASFENSKFDGVRITSGGFPNNGGRNNFSQFYGCPAGRTFMYINNQGDVSCCDTIQKYIGNTHEIPIIDLWHSAKMINLRRKPTCLCEFADICSGSCKNKLSDPYSILG
jgi:radical SAM protein with 4Fe4S-binding SPASM domain